MKATRKLIGACAALVIAIAVATGSTFAWFTTSQNVSIESLEMQVTSGQDDLQIALDKPTSATDWTNLKFGKKISSTDILNGKAIVLDALTSTDNGVKLTNKEGTEATANSSYLEFDISFKSNKELSVLLGSTADVKASDGAAVAAHQIFAWKNITTDEYGIKVDEGTQIVARAADASRVAFVSGTPGTGKVWAPHESAANGGADAKQAGFYKGNLAADYLNFVNATSEDIKTEVATNKLVTLTSDTKYAADSAIIKLAKPAGVTTSEYYGTVTVKVWLEGTDGDCLNSIFEDKMQVVLNFIGLLDTVTPENPS